MRFTDKGIAALKPKAERYEAWEDGRTGFGVRVSPAGRKSWVFMYRFEGTPRRMTFGTYPQRGLADARVDLAIAKQRLQAGVDPGAELTTKRTADREAPSVNELIEEYLEKWERPTKRTASETARVLRKDVSPRWGKRKAQNIKRRDVIVLLDDIVARGAPIQANRTLALVRKMFNFAISRDIVEVNPCHMVSAPGTERQRDRVLRDAEIKGFWEGLPDTDMAPAIQLALKFQLVTVQRKGEVVTVEREEIDFDNAVWTIPAEKTKNNLAHRVPLSSVAMGILTDAEELDGDHRWVFPSPRTNGGITDRAVDHALQRNLAALEVAHFTPHDLRRTASSKMTGDLGISRLTISKILNHVERGVTAVYDRHSYDHEKRQALDAWGRRLEEILSGKTEAQAANVVRLGGG